MQCMIGHAYLDALGTALHYTVFSLQVSMAEAIVVHEDNSIDELLEIMCHHWLRQLLIMRIIQQIQQIGTIHQLPLHKHDQQMHVSMQCAG